MFLKQAAEQSLLDLYGVLRKMSDIQYNVPLEVLHGASIGQHARHIIEFYQCVVNSQGNNAICYDNRQRNLEIEQSITSASQAIQEIAEKLEVIDDTQKVWLAQNFSVEQRETTIQIQSTLGRELAYAFDHAVHHMAFIKIGLNAKYPEIKIDQHLGVAPSTIRNRS